MACPGYPYCLNEQTGFNIEMQYEFPSINGLPLTMALNTEERLQGLANALVQRKAGCGALIGRLRRGSIDRQPVEAPVPKFGW